MKAKLWIGNRWTPILAKLLGWKYTGEWDARFDPDGEVFCWIRREIKLNVTAP